MTRTPKPAIVSLLVLLLVSAGCGDDGGDADDSTTTSAAVPAASAPESPTSIPATDVGAVVYFVRDGSVATAGRAVEPPGVARGTLTALLGGPTDFEADLGLTSAVPAGTRLLGVDVAAGTARVNLSGEFLDDPAADVALRVAQVVFTATQFPTVERVTVLVEDLEVPSVGFDAVPVVEVTRSDFEAVTPAILVESPSPGEAVSAPIAVRGIANTFEANVQYEVTDADGSVLDEGFTTASAGTGTWGDFSFATDVGPGDVVITVFEESAEDGSRINGYAVPLAVG